MEKLFVDGSCNKHTNNCGWGSLVGETKLKILEENTDLLQDMNITTVKTPKGECKVIISKFNDVASQQNNGAELIAMVAGLRIALKHKCKFICSDSSLLVNYWSQNIITSKTKSKMDPLKYKYIQECYELRKQFESNGGKILKISGDNNPADLGYHK